MSFLGDYSWKSGRVSGAVYRYDTKLVELIGKIYTIASYTNPLHPDIFPGICKMEAEVVKIACHLFHGENTTCGTVSSFVIIFKVYKSYVNYRFMIYNFYNVHFLDDFRRHRINYTSM